MVYNLLCGFDEPEFVLIALPPAWRDRLRRWGLFYREATGRPLWKTHIPKESSFHFQPGSRQSAEAQTGVTNGQSPQGFQALGLEKTPRGISCGSPCLAPAQTGHDCGDHDLMSGLQERALLERFSGGQAQALRVSQAMREAQALPLPTVNTRRAWSLCSAVPKELKEPREGE